MHSTSLARKLHFCTKNFQPFQLAGSKHHWSLHRRARFSPQNLTKHFVDVSNIVINRRPLTSTGGAAKLQNQGQPKRYRFLHTQWEWTAWGKTPTSFMWRLKTFKSRYFFKGIKPWSGWNHVQLCPIHTCWMYLIITHFISFPLWSCCVWGNVGSFNWRVKEA